jgi:hypothetical protein
MTDGSCTEALAKVIAGGGGGGGGGGALPPDDELELPLPPPPPQAARARMPISEPARTHRVIFMTARLPQHGIVTNGETAQLR